MLALLCMSMVLGDPVYEVEPVADTVGTVATGLAFGLVSVMRGLDSFDNHCTGVCDPNHLTELDRYAVGRASRTWDQVTDVAEISAIIAPYFLDALDVWLSDLPEAWAELGADALVIAQSQLLAGLVGGALKLAVHRPRPKQYSAETFRARPVRQHAFPSGHAISVSVGPAALATTFWLRHPESPWRWVVVASAAVFAVGMAWGRVEAGEHFPTDVLAGLAIGAASGVLVPWLHLRTGPVELAGGPTGIRLTW